MEQHPIPQQISSYEFKLVGEMTLKQFLKAAGGVVIALMINSTSLIFFIKWPLMFVAAGLGLGMAFVPLEDRPLETWIISFIRSIYAPTVYLYKKKANLNWLNIDMSKVASKAETKKTEGKEALKVKNEEQVREFVQSLPSVKRTARTKEEEVVVEVKTKKAETEIKKPETVVVANNVENKVISETVDVRPANWKDQKTGLSLKSEKLGATGEVVYGTIPMPDIPEISNVVVGMVTDNGGKIVEGAIIEIQDEQGNPSRVLKTNSLGQFKTASQLANGRYLMIAEKEGMDFDRVNVDLRGEIVQPMKIIAK